MSSSGTAAATAAVSSGSALTAWFAATLPIVQWLAAFVAILSGTVAISIGVAKMWRWWKGRK